MEEGAEGGKEGQEKGTDITIVATLTEGTRGKVLGFSEAAPATSGGGKKGVHANASDALRGSWGRADRLARHEIIDGK